MHQIHVGRQPARTYAQRLRELRGVDLDDATAWSRLGGVLIAGERLELDLELAAWWGVDAEHQIAIVARALEWRRHAAVIIVHPRDVGASIAGAQWTQAALADYTASRGRTRTRCEHELALLTYLAGPRDALVQPEQWRARSLVEGVDARLLVQRVDRTGTPLVVAAEARRLNR